MFTLTKPNLIGLLQERTNGRLRFKDNSPLAKLVRTLPPEITTTEDLLKHFKTDLQFSTLLDEIARETKQVFISQIAYIRNTVAADITEVTDSVMTALANYEPFTNRVDIRTAQTPVLFASELLEGMVDGYKDIPYQEVNFKPGVFPTITGPELVETMCIFDGDDFKADVNNLINNYGVSVTDIYAKNFQGKTPLNYPSASKLVEPYYIPFNYIEKLVTFLLAIGLKNNPHANVNLSLKEYTYALSTVEANCGRELHNIISGINKNPPKRLWVTNQLINGVRTIILNKKIYDNFLKLPDATPDTIIGMSERNLLGRILANPSGEIISDIANVISEGNGAARLAAAKLKTRNETARRGVIVDKILACTFELINSDAYVPPAGMTKKDVEQNCRKLLSECICSKVEDAHVYVRMVVAKGLYPKSGAYAYLTAMDKYQTDNRDLQPREAATLAATEALAVSAINQLA